MLTPSRRSFIGGGLALGAASLVALPSGRAWPRPSKISRSAARSGSASSATSPRGCFIDADGKNAGYDVEFGKLLAKAMGVEPEFVTMTVAARHRTVDDQQGRPRHRDHGMYPERAKVVQFSKPYAGLSIIVLGHKDQKIDSAADLAKLRIGVPARGGAGHGADRTGPGRRHPSL